jgi:hypothetical protein
MFVRIYVAIGALFVVSFALQFSYLSPISARIRDSGLVYRGLLRSTPSPASKPGTRIPDRVLVEM